MIVRNLGEGLGPHARSGTYPYAANAPSSDSGFAKVLDNTVDVFQEHTLNKHVGKGTSGDTREILIQSHSLARCKQLTNGPAARPRSFDPRLRSGHEFM